MIKELIRRAKAKTPKVWKQVRNSAASIGVSLGAVVAANAAMGLGLPDQLMTYAKYAIALCVFIVGKAQLKEEK